MYVASMEAGERSELLEFLRLLDETLDVAEGLSDADARPLYDLVRLAHVRLRRRLAVPRPTVLVAVGSLYEAPLRARRAA